MRREQSFTMMCGKGSDSFTMTCGKGSDSFTMTCKDPERIDPDTKFYVS